MAIKIRDTPGANCIAIEPTGFAHPIWGMIIAVLLASMLLVSYVNKNEPVANQMSSQAGTTQSAPHLGSQASDLIPVITGGLGASTSLGGNSSLGGGSH
ncbi:hypothetical protein KF707_20890 [Candidatus Obscuribacterales bacterium]|nr:hypothetical protein [Candidatus Obscuribacterales bacterium]MBX3138699.1 hypothetical protein [Candidatus Obscuribacterales bacterium]MBX3151441.1 hypothetical protein [Candidatus Obscuribacterales bacterium]